jgi:hypothetical protein
MMKYTSIIAPAVLKNWTHHCQGRTLSESWPKEAGRKIAVILIMLLIARPLF